ncbi:hypothetical protein T484DRAFT_1822252, partial [Baffinella frigidus]
SRQQATLSLEPNQPGTGARRGGSALAALRKIAQEEGVSALYKGFAPKALKMGIGGAVGMAAYETLLGMV